MSAGFRDTDETGLTLLELVVTVGLFLIVGLALVGFLDSTTNVTSRATTSSEADKQAQLVLRSVTQEIRAAQNISDVYPASASCPSGGVYPADYDACFTFDVIREDLAGAGCPYTKITYGVIDGTLREDREVFDASCNSVSKTTGKQLAEDLRNSASEPVFTFFGPDGSTLTSTSSLESYVHASAISVTLKLPQKRGQPPVTVSSTLALRNNR